LLSERRTLPRFGSLLHKPKKEEKEAEPQPGSGKTYLKAIPLRDVTELDAVKNEVNSGKILIIRITPLANKSLDDVKRAVSELSEFAESIGGDIARLGEERVVICPPNVKIWREKATVSHEAMPTAA
jgi:SepF-like predicted cell division protein (DUF552 family)